MLIRRAKLSEYGTLLSRLDSGQLWVPYRRYAYFPFLLLLHCCTSLAYYRYNIFIWINCFLVFLLLPFAFVATDLVNELYGYQATKYDPPTALLWFNSGSIY